MRKKGNSIITYDRITRDWTITINGEYIGSRGSYSEALKLKAKTEAKRRATPQDGVESFALAAIPYQLFNRPDMIGQTGGHRRCTR